MLCLLGSHLALKSRDISPFWLTMQKVDLHFSIKVLGHVVEARSLFGLFWVGACSLVCIGLGRVAICSQLNEMAMILSTEKIVTSQ